MGWVKRVMERGQPPVAAPYATTPNGAPFPLRSWPPDTAVDIQNLATWIDRFSFATAAARNTSVPSPWPGMVTYLQDTGTFQAWNGFVWVGDTAIARPTGLNGFSGGTAGLLMNHQGWVTAYGYFDAPGGGTSTSIGNVGAKYKPRERVYITGFCYTASPYAQDIGSIQVSPLDYSLTLTPPPGMTATGINQIGFAGSWAVDFKAVR